jgi:predicted deacylase
LPVNVLVGRRARPRLAIVAGVHGDEYDGVTAQLDLWRELGPAGLAGSVVMVPIANPPAFAAQRRRSPADEIDMNRIFPGDPAGSLTHRLARRIAAEVAPGAALLLSTHGWGSAGMVHPYVEYPADQTVTPASRAAARAFGLPFVEAIDWHPGLLAAVAARAGIPAIEPEIGGQAVARAEGSALYRRGMLNVLRHLGMIEGSPEIATPPRELTGRAGGEVVAPVGGLFRPVVQPGDIISSGATIGSIIDAHGAILATLTAPQAGVVIGLRTRAAIEPGDSAALILALAEESAA